MQARHSRDRLQVTREMLMLCFTYHQVMPEFVDLILDFGEQQNAQNFHFIGFRHDNRLNGNEKLLTIPELGWSGLEVRLCYSLKSVEPSKGQQYWPWSVRTTAVHHAFDIRIGRAVWMIVKGDPLIKSRIKSATDSRGVPELSSFRSIDRAFTSALKTHLLICDWSIEHWHRYISFLEEEFQAISRHSVSTMISRKGEAMNEGVCNTASKNTTGVDPLSLEKVMQSRSQPTRVLPPVLPPLTKTLRSCSQPRQPDQEAFSLIDLQRIYFLEEKANETLLVLNANTSVLAELRYHYLETADSADWPQDLSRDCAGDMRKFERRITSIRNNYSMQKSRTRSLLRLLANRKSLVICRAFHTAQTTADKKQLLGLLEYHSQEASKDLATEAQESARKSETLTLEMHEIAQKTKQETISMRIITFVTLAFLPGTFICVGLSILSTPGVDANPVFMALDTYEHGHYTLYQWQ